MKLRKNQIHVAHRRPGKKNNTTQQQKKRTKKDARPAYSAHVQLICGRDSCSLLKAVYRVIFILGGREVALAVGEHMASVSQTVTALHNRTITVDFLLSAMRAALALGPTQSVIPPPSITRQRSPRPQRYPGEADLRRRKLPSTAIN